MHHTTKYMYQTCHVCVKHNYLLYIEKRSSDENKYYSIINK